MFLPTTEKIVAKHIIALFDRHLKIVKSAGGPKRLEYRVDQLFAMLNQEFGLMCRYDDLERLLNKMASEHFQEFPRIRVRNDGIDNLYSKA